MTFPFTTTSNKSSNSLWMECWLWDASELFGHVVQFVVSSQSSGSSADPTHSARVPSILQ